MRGREAPYRTERLRTPEVTTRPHERDVLESGEPGAESYERITEVQRTHGQAGIGQHVGDVEVAEDVVEPAVDRHTRRTPGQRGREVLENVAVVADTAAAVGGGEQRER